MLVHGAKGIPFSSSGMGAPRMTVAKSAKFCQLSNPVGWLGFLMLTRHPLSSFLRCVTAVICFLFCSQLAVAGDKIRNFVRLAHSDRGRSNIIWRRMAVYARLLKVSNCEKEMQAHSECIQPSKIKCCKKEHISTNCPDYSGRQTLKITTNLN